MCIRDSFYTEEREYQKIINPYISSQTIEVGSSSTDESSRVNQRKETITNLRSKYCIANIITYE